MDRGLVPFFLRICRHLSVYIGKDRVPVNVPKFFRGKSQLFIEIFGKGGGVAEAAGVGDLFDLHFGICQKLQRDADLIF